MSQALVFEPYGKSSANSGVTRYAVSPNAIHVQFQDDRVYVYSHLKPGPRQVETLKQLALKGTGLSTYISQHVHERYERYYSVSTNPSS
jgi:hypothetical protein